MRVKKALVKAWYNIYKYRRINLDPGLALKISSKCFLAPSSLNELRVQRQLCATAATRLITISQHGSKL